jgi:hypothetical protein
LCVFSSSDLHARLATRPAQIHTDTVVRGATLEELTSEQLSLAALWWPAAARNHSR